MAFNCAVRFIALKPRHLIHLALPAGSMGVKWFWVPKEALTVLGGRKPKKVYHLVLDLWNRCLLFIVVPVNSPIKWVYIVLPV